MKIKKLDMRGFSHEMVLVLVVVVSAIVGTGYLVASHAETLCATGSSCPSNGPVSSGSYSAKCTIGNVPATLARGTAMQPQITITNTGTGVLVPHMISFVGTNGGPTTYFKEKSARLTPGQTKTIKVGNYAAAANTPTGPSTVFAHSDTNFKSTKVYFDCQQAFQLT